MRRWPIEDAETRFGELFETCMNEGPQVVTEGGIGAAVLVPLHGSARSPRPGLKELLLAATPRGDLLMPEPVVAGGISQRVRASTKEGHLWLQIANDYCVHPRCQEPAD